MSWFKRKKRTSGNQEIRNWDIWKSGDQGTDRIPGTVRSTGSMIHTAAVLSDLEMAGLAAAMFILLLLAQF